MTKNVLTEENFKKLAVEIEKNKGKKGALMPVLHKAQHIFGCVPLEVQQKISDELLIPVAEIYGVVTFYSQFTLVPKGEYTVAVCMGTACYVKGSQLVIDKMSETLGVKVGGTSPDGKFSLDASRCIGACGLAPVMTVNEDVHGRLTADEVAKIIEKY
jgi:formate dehydrogenase (NAD+, ferredoxin) subunit C